MEIRALTCDTYGTLVDWRGSILDELRALGRSRGIAHDWEAFLDDWKSAYRPGMDKVNRGEWPWTTIDVIYRRRLDEVLQAHAITGLGEVDLEHLNRVWWRLRPWPDTVAWPHAAPPPLRHFTAVQRELRGHGPPGALRRPSVGLRPHGGECPPLQAGARGVPHRHRAARPRSRRGHDGGGPQLRPRRRALPWDAHRVHPTSAEYGPGQTSDLAPESDWDVVARDMDDLADSLGA